MIDRFPKLFFVKTHPACRIPLRIDINEQNFFSATAMEAERLIAVVVLPTPPFWLAMQITRAMIQFYERPLRPEPNMVSGLRLRFEDRSPCGIKDLLLPCLMGVSYAPTTIAMLLNSYSTGQA